MSYDEEEVISDSGFNPNSEDGDLDDEHLFNDEEPIEEETPGFRFDEEETEGV